MKKKTILLTVITLIGLSGLIVWASLDKSAGSTKGSSLTTLTENDIDLILASQSKIDKNLSQTVNDSNEIRQAFIAGLKEHLALANGAKEEGLDKDPAFIRNFDYKSRILLADLYESHLGKSAKDPYPVEQKEIDAVWQNSANEANFNSDMQALQAIQNDVQTKMGTGITPGVLAGESLERAKKKWARTKIISDLAKADAEFIGRHDVKLRLQILEAGILSSDLLRKHWNHRIKPTETEISEFIKYAPQFDLQTKRNLAESVLQKILSGEDLSKLAKQYSEHRPTKDTGGKLNDLNQGDMPVALETALLTAEPGKVIDRLIETELGFHIARLDRKETKKAESENEIVTYSFSQILFQNKFEQPGAGRPGIPAPFMPAQEIAKFYIEKEKRGRFIAEVVSKYEITISATVPEIK